jgi:glucose/arabinose dehydrogenase
MNARSILIVGSLLCVLATAGCSGAQGPSANKPAVAPAEIPNSTTGNAASATSQVSMGTAGTASAATTPTPPVSLAKLSVSVRKVTGGLVAPVYVTNAGDDSGRLFVVEQPGRIRVVRGSAISSGAFLDIRSRVGYGGERGLLGLAFAANYKTTGRFFVNYTDKSGNTVVARFAASPPSSDRPRISGPTTLLYIKQPYANHNGGCLQFGPDGMLYIGMGDGGSGGDPGNRAQSFTTPLGKLLRINVSGSKYTVPKDNPYATQGYPRNIIWARGLRNPWRFSFDKTLKQLWIGDVGQNTWEEIDLVSSTSKGRNYGWHKWEGNHPYPPGSPAPTRRGFTFPLVEYKHPTGEAVTGGYVYRGTAYPAMSGAYVYGDYVKGWIAGIRRYAPNGALLSTPESRRLLSSSLKISSFGVSQSNELYVTDLRGALYQVAGTPK